MPPRILSAALAAAVLIPAAVRADEGMWQPSQMPRLAKQLEARGLKMNPGALSDLAAKPLDAVISLGGCTASFVSPDGLVVTNHHCGYGAIQYNSTPERDLLTNGFVARSFAEELPAEPTARIYVTQDIADVTARINAGLSDGMDGKARFDAIDARTKALVAECEQPGGLHCEVYYFNGGLQFSLIRQMEIKDVRLVYAPAEAIGKFGGDEDNFEWPRHTGDWSFLRAYVGKDGKPAPFSKDNVPYRPKSWLQVSKTPLAAGDYVMVAGYPGSTNRYRLADEVDDAIGWEYPLMVHYYDDYLGIVERNSRDDKAVALKYASAVAGLNNARKLFQGQLDGFAKMKDPVGDKRAQEAALKAWLGKRGAQGQAQAEAIAALERELAAQRATRERDQWFGAIAGGLPGMALTLYRNAIERAKPDAEREQGFQDRDAPRLQGRMQTMDKRFDPKVDRALTAMRLRAYAAQVPAAQRVPELDAWLGIKPDQATIPTLDRKLDALYRGTRLGAVDARMQGLKADRAALEASKDPALQFAVALMPAVLRLDDEAKAREGRISALRPQYMQAMIDYNAAQGRPVYPDANGSLRITFGSVRGYAPKDGVQMTPFTTLAGVAAKTTGKDPFVSPQAELDAIAQGKGAQYRMASLGDVPVNFLSDVDTTGGNSGSPTLNAKGELVGLLFDGNYESLSADWIFNPALTRSIHVDARYMRWVMDEVDHADRLLEEMGLPHD